MQLTSKLLRCGLAVGVAGPLFAQDLAPRAYLITPKDSNAIILTWSYYNGGLNFNGSAKLWHPPWCLLKPVTASRRTAAMPKSWHDAIEPEI